MTSVDILRAAPVLGRTFGVRGARERAVFELRRRLNAFRTAPSAAAAKLRAPPVSERWPFRPDAARVLAATARDEALARAGRVVRGEHQAFRWRWMARPLAADDWSLHPQTGHRYDNRLPWHRVPHFDPAAGDIKDVWEAARFAWAYDLARGWMLTCDDRFADAFWTSFMAFIQGCPPFRGVQWACGQETAIRALAWLWCEGAFTDAPSSTSDRVCTLWRALAWSAERIEDAIGYAESQRNNHGISEATGLIAIGARLRHGDPRAARWLRAGKRRLERMVRDQFARDGWYIQHSFSYLRLALDQLVLAERALRAVEDGLSPSAVHLVRAAIGLLGEVIDPATGEVPNHGPNDGAFVLPLSTRPYRDFVPALTAAAATFDVPLPHGVEPDGETLAWLGAGRPRSAAPARLPRVVVGESGWVHALTEGIRLFARAGAYTSRPGHIDPLHVDLWIDGRPVAVDAGTFRYAAPPPWHNGLADVEVHNTVTIEGHPPARRGPRFLWLRWPHARVVDVRVLEDAHIRIVLENRSWIRHGIRHLRTCELGPHGAVIVDELTAGSEGAVAVLNWLLDGDAEQVAVGATPAAEAEIRRGEEHSVAGWISECYAMRRPGTSVRVRTALRGGRARFVSAFGDRRGLGVHQLLEGSTSAVACSG